jgi:hypothetical protein
MGAHRHRQAPHDQQLLHGCSRGLPLLLGLFSALSQWVAAAPANGLAQWCSANGTGVPIGTAHDSSLACSVATDCMVRGRQGAQLAVLELVTGQLLALLQTADHWATNPSLCVLPGGGGSSYPSWQHVCQVCSHDLPVTQSLPAPSCSPPCLPSPWLLQGSSNFVSPSGFGQTQGVLSRPLTDPDTGLHWGSYQASS